MKKITFKLFMFLSFMCLAQNEITHIDFDTNNADIGFESWNASCTFSKETNPAPDATNASTFVGLFTAAESQWGQDNTIGIGVINPTTVFTAPFNLTALDYFKMSVFVTEEVTVTLHLENSPDWGNYVEATAAVEPSQVNQWTELTFDFSGVSNIMLNNIVIKVDGPDWTAGDFMFFDNIIGPELYSSPAYTFIPTSMSNDISVGTNLEIETNDFFYGPAATTISDLSDKVAVRIGDENGSDVPFTATLTNNNKITIDPTGDLDYLTTYWFGIIDNSMYHSNGSSVSDVSSTFTTKEAQNGDINVMMFDYETTETDTPFESWGSAGFAQISNPDPDDVNPSANVGQFTHPGGSWTSGIESSGTFDNIDFAETPFFRIKVWVDKPINIVFKLQNNPSYWENSEFTYSIPSDQTSQWVELTFNFSNVNASNYNRVQLWFDGDISGGSVAGDVYYFDDISKSNVPPAANNIFSPSDGAIDVVQYTQLSISSNFQFLNLDGSQINDPANVLELRENDSNGPVVPFSAALLSTNSVFKIVPDYMLNPGVVYWYGIKNNMIKYDENQQTVNDLNASFTVTQGGMPEMIIYNDFDGTSVCTVSETMGDPASPFNLTATDPTGASNNVMQWDKGASWGGWERLHFELNAPFDAASDDIFSFRVYSPVSTGIRFKVADAKDDWDQTGFYETDEEILFANQWQTVYLDLSELADAVAFNHIFVFLGRGETTDVTFYFDDFMGPALQTTASIDEISVQNISIYPNPVEDFLYFKNLHGMKSIKIFELNGRLIRSELTNKNHISVSNLNPGFYFIQVNGQIKKIIKY